MATTAVGGAPLTGIVTSAQRRSGDIPLKLIMDVCITFVLCDPSRFIRKRKFLPPSEARKNTSSPFPKKGWSPPDASMRGANARSQEANQSWDAPSEERAAKTAFLPSGDTS